MTLLVIGNSDSGTSDGLDAAVAALEAGADVEVVHTASPDELDDVVRREATLVVAGGDGSLHAVVAALHRADLLGQRTVALIPLGTGNDFARGVGIPEDPAAAAAVVLAGHEVPVDILVDDNDGIVINSVHVGAGAEASRAATRWKKLGKPGYVIGAAITAVRPPTLKLKVTVDGVTISRRSTLQVAIGNAPYVGGGTELTPEADPTDGSAHVVVAHAVRPSARAAYALGLRRGDHHRRRDVRSEQACEITIEGEPFHVSADGELDGPITRRSWSVKAGALTMILPKDHQEA